MAIPIPAILAGVGAIGGLFGRNRSQSQQEGGQDFSGSTFGSATPQMMQEALPLRDMLLQQFMGHLGSPMPQNQELLHNIRMQNMARINQDAVGIGERLQSEARRRGLGASLAGQFMPQMATEQARAQGLSNLDTFLMGEELELPFRQEAMMGNRLAQAGGFLQGLPTGMQTQQNVAQTGRTFQSGTGSQSRNPILQALMGASMGADIGGDLAGLDFGRLFSFNRGAGI